MLNFTRGQMIAAYAMICLGLVGTGLLLGRSGIVNRTGNEVRLIQPNTSVSDSSRTQSTSDGTPAMLRVHVAGAVKKPGVYGLKVGSRVEDAIKAAGGAAPKGDLETINLAQELEDGQQIYIAQKGQVPRPKVSVVTGGKDTSGASAPQTREPVRTSIEKLKVPGEGKVNINTAGLEELQRLPGVGPTTAERILEYRREHGKFESVDELDEVKGIGPKKLEKLKPFVSL